MQITISIPDGILYNDLVDYVLIRNQDGEFMIMKDHMPIISIIKEGYIKMYLGNNSFYVYLFNGVLKQDHNIINVIAQEAHIGESIEKAKDYILEIREERTTINKRKSVDSTKLEKDLRKNIKDSKAGKL